MNRSHFKLPLLCGFALVAAACTSAPPRSVRPHGRGSFTSMGASGADVDPIVFQGSLPIGEGRLNAALTVAGYDRTVALVVPHDRPASAPLVIMLHGTNSEGAGVIDECGGLGLANHHGVIVAAPNARSQSRTDWDHPDERTNDHPEVRTDEHVNNTWWETHPNVDPERNADLLLVRAVIAAASRDYHIDPSRVYVMGHSNGAFFGLLAAMTLGDRLAGVALNAGGLVRCATTASCAFRAGQVADCSRYPSMPSWCRCEGPALPIGISASTARFPFVLSHGTNDSTTSVQYTCELARELLSAGYSVTVNLRPGDGHFCDSDFAELSWRYLATGRSPGMKWR